jgi:hypothetical protein
MIISSIKYIKEKLECNDQWFGHLFFDNVTGMCMHMKAMFLCYNKIAMPPLCHVAHHPLHLPKSSKESLFIIFYSLRKTINFLVEIKQDFPTYKALGLVHIVTLLML